MKDFTEFRKFIMRGNLLELATAFILGVAFAAVVSTFTNGIVLAIVAAIFGEPNFNDVGFTINDSFFAIGTFLNALLNFVIVAFVMFLVIKAYELNRERIRRDPQPDEAEPLSLAEELLTEIRDLLQARP